jgi:hypothetical protein
LRIKRNAKAADGATTAAANRRIIVIN